ncbi:MAG: YdcF family protein [Nostoc sp.]
MKRKLKLVKWVLAIALLLTSIIPARIAIAFYQTPVPQAIFVLGGASERMKFAAQFWQSRQNLDIWVSDFAWNLDVDRRIFLEYGVSDAKLHLDGRATDTVTNFTTLAEDFANQRLQHTDFRLPTKLEFRYMFYLSVLTGADGLLFWIHYLSSPSWNKSVLYPTIKEFQDYIPAIVRGEDLSNPVQVNNSNIEVKLFPVPNTKKYLIIAVNHTLNQIHFVVKLTHSLAGKIVAFNEKTITNLSPDGSFSTRLNPYEVKLYQVR